MGQMTYAIMYGVATPDDVDLWGEDGDSGLVGQWREHCRDEIAAWDREHPRTSFRDPWPETLWVPQSPYEGLDIVGFYVAVGASGKPGIPHLEGCALADVESTHYEAYTAARARWDRFAAWATSKGVTFEAPRLYLTETEVA